MCYAAQTQGRLSPKLERRGWEEEARSNQQSMTFKWELETNCTPVYLFLNTIHSYTICCLALTHSNSSFLKRREICDSNASLTCKRENADKQKLSLKGIKSIWWKDKIFIYKMITTKNRRKYIYKSEIKQRL